MYVSHSHIMTMLHKEPSLFYYLPIVRRERDAFMSFPESVSAK